MSQGVDRRSIFLAALVLVASGVVLFAILLPELSGLDNIALQVGDVAAQDIAAPFAITYESQASTEKQRRAAESQVAPVYNALDTSIARRQLERLRAVLAFINSVRADPFASQEQKLADLAALEFVQLGRETGERILELSDSRWQAVQQETIVVLEEVMRNPIRDDRLEEARRSVPASVSLTLPEGQARIVADLVVAFVAPNSAYNETLTQESRQKAREAVRPVTRSYIAGEIVVRRGQVITPEILEALENLNLSHSGLALEEVLSAVLLTLLTSAFFLVFLRRNPRLLSGYLSPSVFTLLFLAFLLGARLILPGHIVLPYLYPTMAFSLTVAMLFSPELALVSALPLSVLVAYDLPNALELTLFAILSSFFGVIALRRAQRVGSFFSAAGAIALSGIVILVLYRLPEPNTDWLGLLTLCGAAVFNGIASAGVSVLLQFFFAQLLGMTTALQLIELTRPDHALLQFLLRNAPGTYQHSLQVANLAEQAAEQIGADALLTRVGALYHDVGKAANPFFFIENQPPGDLNPHDDLDPALSAATIINHVKDGVELARKFRLPRRIRDFIEEHHGTMFTRYQYVRAVEASGGDDKQVDPNKFRYPGPRPRSRETALVMLADGCEARMRAERPKDEGELLNLIKSVMEKQVKLGELDETNLTLRDLDLIVASFVATLRGVFHPRIEYPQLEARKP